MVGGSWAKVWSLLETVLVVERFLRLLVGSAARYSVSKVDFSVLSVVYYFEALAIICEINQARIKRQLSEQLNNMSLRL